MAANIRLLVVDYGEYSGCGYAIYRLGNHSVKELQDNFEAYKRRRRRKVSFQYYLDSIVKLETAKENIDYDSVYDSGY